MPASTIETEIQLKWAFKNPHLVQQTIDELFEQHGNMATYELVQSTDHSVQIITTMHTGDDRTSMFEVMQQKHDIEVGLAMAVEEFWDGYKSRPGNEWVVNREESARAKNLNQMEVA